MPDSQMLPVATNRLPRLTFAPLAWLKLQYFCHAGDTEIGGFGISAEDDLLYVEEFVTVRQRVTPVTVRFEDEAVADFFDGCVDRGLPAERFARIWCHTHPAASVTPSHTDEETFERGFGRCNWAVMFILGRTGNTYARLASRAGPEVQVELPVAVDWAAWPECLSRPSEGLGKLAEQWLQEHVAHVHRLSESLAIAARTSLAEDDTEVPWWEDHPWSSELDAFAYVPVEEKIEHESDHRLPVP
jgi:hypothetical protein